MVHPAGCRALGDEGAELHPVQTQGGRLGVDLRRTSSTSSGDPKPYALRPSTGPRSIAYRDPAFRAGTQRDD
jgi:hypothetical protein